MEFTFKRDDEGKERIYCRGMCVAQMFMDSDLLDWNWVTQVDGVTGTHINEAIERADEAGFWKERTMYVWLNNEVTIDVPIAETTVLSVTLDGDES